MWFKVDDAFLDHPKVMAAARTLGGAKHIGRIAAVWLEAGLYASKYLTDGFVPTIAVQTFKTDARAEDVMNACVNAGLFRAGAFGVEPGYFFHDWQHHNPSAAEVKIKRDADRARKAAQKTAKNGRRPLGLRVESIRTIDGIRAESARIPRGIRTESNALARARDPVPVPKDQDPEEPRGERRARPARMDLEAYELTRHLHAKTHALIEAGPPYVDNLGPVPGELVAALGTFVVQDLKSASPHPRDLTAIVDAVIARRAARDQQRQIRQGRDRRELGRRTR